MEEEADEDEEEVQRRRQVVVLRRVEEEEEHHTKGTGGKTVATMAKGGRLPLTIVSLVEARTVATYVGEKLNADNIIMRI